MKRLLLGFLSIIAVLIGIPFFWLYVYSRDLPSLDALAGFAPSYPTQITDTCSGVSVTAIPYDSFGDYALAAMRVAETGEDGPTAVNEVLGNSPNPGRIGLSSRISRTLFCGPSRTLSRDVAELRIALRLERRFSRRELLTIYLNRIRFGRNLEGISSASQYYFGKDPAQLNAGEAALLAALVRSPSRFSPVLHAESAAQRRNEILEDMVRANAITAQEANKAKASPLGVSIRD
jgi:membrane carboxypeptidase/penicillin-binding protein